MKSLSELISVLRRPILSSYCGDDWKVPLLTTGKLTLYRNPRLTLSLVKSQANSYDVLKPSEILVLEGELRLSNGDTIREKGVYHVSDPTVAIFDRESVFLHLEK